MTIMDGIEAKRRQLLELATRQGLRHPDVIKASQQLDELLDDYYRPGSTQ